MRSSAPEPGLLRGIAHRSVDGRELTIAFQYVDCANRCAGGGQHRLAALCILHGQCDSEATAPGSYRVVMAPLEYVVCAQRWRMSVARAGSTAREGDWWRGAAISNHPAASLTPMAMGSGTCAGITAHAGPHRLTRCGMRSGCHVLKSPMKDFATTSTYCDRGPDLRHASGLRSLVERAHPAQPAASSPTRSSSHTRSTIRVSESRSSRVDPRANLVVWPMQGAMGTAFQLAVRLRADPGVGLGCPRRGHIICTLSHGAPDLSPQPGGPGCAARDGRFCWSAA